MLQHGHTEAILPERVVVLGANGFVAAAAVRRLRACGVTVLSLPRATLDLLQPDAGLMLARILCPHDALLFVSAKAPVRNNTMLIDNLRMAATVCEAIRQAPVKHVVYVSSDAVYADSDAPLTELSCTQPASLHGVMHLAREVMLAQAFSGPLCLLRPTLIYGADDPHNGYGPNRFMRLAAAGVPIELFGDGEERRDHIWIEDVAEVVARVLTHQSQGVLNVATGIVTSFADLARIAARLFPSVRVKSIPRSGAIPHNGLRLFDTTALRSAFPGYQFTTVREGLEGIYDAYKASGPR